MSIYQTDFLIVGGGIIGLTLSRCLKKSFPFSRITVLEKEKQCGLHASGRNSGVLHAGFYYTPDSLKAKLTKLGNQMLTEYCEQKNIPINKCGKLVVAKNDADLLTMKELLRRAKENDVALHELNENEVQEIEPRAITYQKALFSPSTSSINPNHVITALKTDAENEGINIYCNVKYLKRHKNGNILTTMGDYKTNYFINAGGLYADKIARDFSFSDQYCILPFKGIYLLSDNPLFTLNTHIYPVPDLKNPFLGVHVTLGIDGKIKIGPTAIPVFWREQYANFSRFRLDECIDIMRRQCELLIFSQFDFKNFALEEMKKCFKPYLIKLATSLAKDIKIENFARFGSSGIRAQLLHIKEKKLEMDFLLEGDAQSMHILNAVSPAFTSSFPFAEFVCNKIKCLI